jgi:hypothetical protein
MNERPSRTEAHARELLPWGRARSAKHWLRRHPVLCVVLLAPMVEYLSGSSQISLVALNPLVFFLILAQNLGFYGSGVLLIREARVRWRLGWPSIFLLGAAYAILEEGLMLKTMFEPVLPTGTALSEYGRWLGVNWVFVAGVVLVHILFSISVPILLTDLALPETRGVSLLNSREVRVVAAIWALDFAITLLVVGRYWPGYAIYGGCVLAIVALVAAARLLPRLRPSGGPPRAPANGGALAIGVAVFFSQMLWEDVTVGHAPFAIESVAGLLGLDIVFLVLARRIFEDVGSRRSQVAFCTGTTLALMFGGLVGNFPLELNLVYDAAVILFLVWLWRRYPYRPDSALPEAPPPTQVPT